MITQCANPGCNVQVHSLKGGRLYRFNFKAPQPLCSELPNSICDFNSERATVYFWMCRECSSKFSLSFGSQDGLQLTELKQLPRGDALVIVDEPNTALDAAPACDQGAPVRQLKLLRGVTVGSIVTHDYVRSDRVVENVFESVKASIEGSRRMH